MVTHRVTNAKTALTKLTVLMTGLFLSGCASKNIPVPACGPSGYGASGYGGAEYGASGFANSGVGCADGSCGTVAPPIAGATCGPEGCGNGIQQCGTNGAFGGHMMNAGCDIPRELRKVTLPDYRIEPPDVLLIESANNLRPANDPILAGEAVIIQANRTIPIGADDSPIDQAFKTINGPYVIGADGYVNLGPDYGRVLVASQPIKEIQRRVGLHLKQILKNPQVMVTLPDPSAKQVVAGQHLVRQDGTVGLGIYGSVRVAGLTLEQAKYAIENHLSQHMHQPQVYVDVLGYNSKKYYIIADGGGAGEQVYQMPSTGNETVLDAIAQIRGLPTVSDPDQIWIARPSTNPNTADQILPVDWEAIAEGGQTCTNYQIFPGDRLYVRSDRWIEFDTNFSKITAPIERVLGFAILGNAAVRGVQGQSINGN